MFGWLIAIAWQVNDWLATLLLTGIMIGMGIWNLISLGRQTGPAISHRTNIHMAVYALVILMVFNLRLDVWMAIARHASLDEIHALYPQWIAPVLSLAFILWVILVWRMTNPGRPMAGGETVQPA